MRFTALLVFACWLPLGCSLTFDANAPTIPLLGNPPAMAGIPRLNTQPVTDEAFSYGADGHLWLVMSQLDKSWRAVNLYDESKVETIVADNMIVLSSALIYTKSLSTPDSPVQQLALTERSLGEQPGHTFTLPSNGPAIVVPGGADDVFAYVVADPSIPGYVLQRRDGSFSRTVPWPKGVDPTDPFSDTQLIFFFDTGAGLTFYDRNDDGRIVGHHTKDNLDIDIGIRPRVLQWVDDNTLVTCGNDGVRLVYVTPDSTNMGKLPPERVLDEDICQPTLLTQNSGYVYYEVGTVVRKAKLDGSEPPRAVYDFSQNRVLRIGFPDDSVIYSTDPSTRYIHGAGDGWLGNWKFMQRGTDLTYTSDQKTLFWLEDSAQSSGVGELKMVTLPAAATPGGTPRPLAQNVHDYTQLADGRVLCNDNFAFSGTFNRLVLIDLKKNESQWFADSSNHWSLFNSSKEAIVDVVTGATSGHDVVRMTLPPPLP